jgi:hypothetical protein
MILRNISIHHYKLMINRSLRPVSTDHKANICLSIVVLVFLGFVVPSVGKGIPNVRNYFVSLQTSFPVFGNLWVRYAISEDLKIVR